MSGNNIKVVCRFRPQNATEIKEGGVPIVDIDHDTKCVILKGESPSTFAFDHVFDGNTTQKYIFDTSIKSIVDDVVAGYNGTIFCYGQSGSGKTYTMMGSDMDDEQGKGIIPRMVGQIFTTIMSAPENIEFTVRISYMEIYMEKVRDLLNPSVDNLAIHEDKTSGVYVKGLLEVYVSSADEVYDVMRRGSSNRVVAFTNMNAESSRSHSLVLITITQKNLDSGVAKSGKLYLVDLAGSEKVGKTGASGQTLEEAKKINKSLTALGMVINSLTDGKSSHIPYRDSKLTRILQESLGGNSRTTLIVNCSPSSYNETETISTLRFGVRAKTIKNKAKVNADLSPAELKALLKKLAGESMSYQHYSQALEGEIHVWRSGGSVPETQWATMSNALSLMQTTQSSAATAAASSTTQMPGSPSPLVTSSEDPTSTVRLPTPLPTLEKDERDQFAQRETDLLDQIAEKEEELAQRTEQLTALQLELTTCKKTKQLAVSANRDMTSSVGETKIQLDRAMFESKETGIMIDALKESNHDMALEINELRQVLAQMQQQQARRTHRRRENDLKKPNVTAAAILMAIHEKQQQLLDLMKNTDTSMSDREQAWKEVNVVIEQYQSSVRELTTNKDIKVQHRRDLEHELETTESEYKALMEKANDQEQDASMEHLAATVEDTYGARRELLIEQLDILDKDISNQEMHEGKVAVAIAELKLANEDLHDMILLDSSSPPATTDKDIDYMRKTMNQQLSECDIIKRALMNDLQKRSEQAVELELALKDTRERYVQLIRSTSNQEEQQKMTQLESNLERLSNTQKELMDKNASLKKEMSLAGRKLTARNERIEHLESILQDSQTKYNMQTEKFETQMASLRQRLQQARGNTSAFQFSRIAKPLRGGGLNGGSEVVDQDAPSKDRRTSWMQPFRK